MIGTSCARSEGDTAIPCSALCPLHRPHIAEYGTLHGLDLFLKQRAAIATFLQNRTAKQLPLRRPKRFQDGRELPGIVGHEAPDQFPRRVEFAIAQEGGEFRKI